jgi:hypothetical protein
VLYLDIDDPIILNYINFHIYGTSPVFVNRLPSKVEFWRGIGASEWLLDLIGNGVKIPFEKVPPPLNLRNNKSVLDQANVQ